MTDELQSLNARLDRLETECVEMRRLLNVALSTADTTPTPTQGMGSSGTMSPELKPVIGYVTPVGAFANVRNKPSTDEGEILFQITGPCEVRNDAAAVDSKGFMWWQIGIREFVREDVVTYTKERPFIPAVMATPAPISDRWPAPVSDYTVTNWHNARGHRGIDFACPRGTPVLCGPNGGLVLKASPCPKCDPNGTPGVRVMSNNYGYGSYVIVQYANALLPATVMPGMTVYALYGHLSAIAVSEGQVLFPYQEIGRVGSTGDSTGTHLHFECRVSETQGAKWGTLEDKLIDPLTLIRV